MSERDQQAYDPGAPGGGASSAGASSTGASSAGASAAGAPPAGAPSGEQWRDQTAPGMTPIRGGAAAEPTQGYEGQYAQGYAPPGYGGDHGWGTSEDATAPEYSSRPVAVRRPDAVAGLLLVLAGIAAGVSLLLPWVKKHPDVSGWDLVHAGLHAARSGVGKVFDQGYWEPMLVVAAGAVLLVLGLLMFIPARTHRFLGALALLVALAAAAGVLTPMAQDHWKPSIYDLGMWFAVATAALGLLGALKALLTGPKLGTHG